MGTMRRFVKDESGMTLAIAIIMIVLIGVMGAGILTFVNRDLGTVVEENRGQRAFELADAGVNAAKRQLTADCSNTNDCEGHYNGAATTPTNLPDNQWSYSNGSGLTLRDLNGDGDLSDWVNVTIKSTSTSATRGVFTFTITSTGHYGSSTRKVEAKLKGAGLGGGGGTGGLGSPVYYTPSSIKIEANSSSGLTLDDISLFTDKDIIIQNLTTPALFSGDYNSNAADKSVISTSGTKDELRDWDSTKAPFNPTGDWNTTGRIETTVKKTGQTETLQTDAFEKPGLAALGRICGFSGTGAGVSSCGSAQSVADGISSYDSTTGKYIFNGTNWVLNTNTTATGNYPRPIVLNEAGANMNAKTCTFMAKPFPTTSPANTGCYLSFPFPHPITPKGNVLKARAQGEDTATDRHYWDVSVDGAPNWDTLFPGGGDWQRLVFIDARGGNVTYDTSGVSKGGLIVWCGSLQTNTKFQGIVFSLKGDGSSFGATNCQTNANSAINTNSGLIRNNGAFLQAWTYANGGAGTSGTSTRAGIELGPGSTIKSVPSGNWDLLLDIFDEPVPINFTIEGWRELYS